MQQLCPQREVIFPLNSQAAFPSVKLWFWRQLSPQNQRLTGQPELLALKIGRTRYNLGVWETKLDLELVFCGLVSVDLKAQSPWSLGTLCSESLSYPHEHFLASLSTLFSYINPQLLTSLWFSRPHLLYPSLEFRIYCLHVLQVLSWRQPQGCQQKVRQYNLFSHRIVHLIALSPLLPSLYSFILWTVLFRSRCWEKSGLQHHIHLGYIFPPWKPMTLYFAILFQKVQLTCLPGHPVPGTDRNLDESLVILLQIRKIRVMSRRELPSSVFNKSNVGFLLPHLILSSMCPPGHLQPGGLSPSVL